MSIKEKIDSNRVPRHVAIIMDGNGRWAEKQDKPRTFGHENGVDSVKQCIEAAMEVGVGFLTLYAFSMENWNRPKAEIDTLMDLLADSIVKETETLIKNKISLRVIGDMSMLDARNRENLERSMEETAQNSKMCLILALSYSAKWEIVQAVKSIAKMVQKNELKVEEIDEKNFELKLNTYFCPDPELLIRTSGEYRLSNFLLWQIAYAELYFTDTLWPEFKKEDFFEAIVDYQKRERRFGKISSQIK